MENSKGGKMAKQHLKLARGLGDFVPTTINFSDLDTQDSEQETSFEIGDEGIQSSRLEDNLAYEELVVNIISNLELREGLIFVFELLRDNGFSIDHGAFAKAI